jgi:ATP-dependent Clp protease ATP-binding subunit ClpA
MTTNAGAADLAKPAIGFEREGREGDDTEAIERMFTPEFRNRLDAVIRFSSLSPEVMAKVVDKFVLELEMQLADRDVTIKLTGGAREWLAKKGHDKLFGARPLARMIQEHVKKPLAEELLFGKLAKGGIVEVGIEDGKMTFDYPAPKDPKGKKKGRGKGKGQGGNKKPALVK